MGQMANKGFAGATSMTPAGTVWVKASQALKSELGDDTSGSWLAQAALRMTADGGLCLVTPTGIARDWIRRYAWRRIGELWAANDPEGRTLSLKSRLEFEAEGGECLSQVLEIEVVDAVSSDAPTAIPAGRGGKSGGLQERFTFENFVVGPTNEFAHAVARRVASWADGHFNPVVFHGPYGFRKTHLLNALASEAVACAPHRKVGYPTAPPFLSGVVAALLWPLAADV